MRYVGPLGHLRWVDGRQFLEATRPLTDHLHRLLLRALWPHCEPLGPVGVRSIEVEWTIDAGEGAIVATPRWVVGYRDEGMRAVTAHMTSNPLPVPVRLDYQRYPELRPACVAGYLSGLVAEAMGQDPCGSCAGASVAIGSEEEAWAWLRRVDSLRAQNRACPTCQGEGRVEVALPPEVYEGWQPSAGDWPEGGLAEAKVIVRCPTCASWQRLAAEG